MSDTTELVDLAVIFPDLEIKLKYACADNITGKAIYQQARCLLHKDAITALAKSISIAQLSGFVMSTGTSSIWAQGSMKCTSAPMPITLPSRPPLSAIGCC